MINELPSVRLPECFTRLCCMNIRNSRKDYGEVADIIQRDKFLNILVNQLFRDDIEKHGIDGTIMALGWDGLRDRIAGAYLYKARNGRFPDIVDLEEVKEVAEIEKRFEFISTDGCHRVFLLSFYLTLAAIEMEKEFLFVGHDFISIGPEVDEILKMAL